MKILHIAPFNIAGVPLTLVRAEEKTGHDSRLITFGKEKQNRENDICLHLPFLNAGIIKKMLYPKNEVQNGKLKFYDSIPPYWKPPGNLAGKLFKLRDSLWERKLKKFFTKFDIDDFDVLQLDSGLGFLRNAKIIKELKNKNKKIICCYYGSDLRIRGAIREIDQISDLNVTFEYDHLNLHPNIHLLPFPFDATLFKTEERQINKKIIVGHAPTNRAAKGTDFILSAIEKLQKQYPVELLLIENLPYKKAIALKNKCTIFIDQISELGYGINSLEAFALGIPVLSSLSEKFKEISPDHPFIEIDKSNLVEKFAELFENPETLPSLGLKGRKWVEDFHDPVNVVKKINSLLENV